MKFDLFKGGFQALWKVTPSFVISVCLSFERPSVSPRSKKSDAARHIFINILYSWLPLKQVDVIQVLLKSDKKTGALHKNIRNFKYFQIFVHV
jgi:hypothetical protein